MSRVVKVDYGDGTFGRRFDCPGCGEKHAIPVTGPKVWGFNGDDERPTFTPSILVRGVKGAWGPVFDPTPTVCHSFVKDGRIRFLDDCTHALAGKEVDLPAV
jgi:hypothetical protein